ncbi:VanZ like family protein [compost metagenome]
MPLAYLVPAIFTKKINTMKRFTLFIFCIALLIEVSQLIFMTGQVDIDDVILNTIGAIIFYFILNIKIVKKVLIKIKLI